MIVFLLFILISVPVALCRGGRFENLAQLRIRGWWLLLIALLGQVTYVVWFTAPEGGLTERAVFLLLTHGLVVVIALINSHLPGLKMMAAGFILNLVVMVANGGWMPLAPEAVRAVQGQEAVVETGTKAADAKNIILEREETRLWFLSDVLLIPRPFPWPAALSPGDILIDLGAAYLIYMTMTGKRQKGYE